MLERRGYIASGILHLGLVLLFILGFPDLFGHRLPEETPLVVQLVKIGPETRATQLTKTPPTPEAKPEAAEEPPPRPPRVMPQSQPPPMLTPPEPQLATPEPPPPAPQEKPKPPAPIPPVPALKPPTPPEVKPVNVHVPSPKPRPPTPKPKPEETQKFDALLKNLAKNDPAPSEPDQPRQSRATHRASSQPIAPLGAQLTASELDLVKEQIEQCWNIPAGARDADDLKPEFRVHMNSDGTVRAADLLNQGQLGDPAFRAAADAAYRALKNPACQPLKLPPDKFDQWQTFTITFDPKDIAG